MKRRIILSLALFIIILFPNVSSALEKKTYSQILQETIDLQNGEEIGQTTETCMESDDSGKYYTAKWNENLGDKGRELIGAVWACRRKVISVDTNPIKYSYTSTNKNTAESNVKKDVDDKNAQYKIPSCCNWKGDPKKGYSCSDSSACNPTVCSTVTCTSTTSSSGGGSGGSGGSGGGGGGRVVIRVVSQAQKIITPIPIREFTTYYSIKERMNCIPVDGALEEICVAGDPPVGDDDSGGNGGGDSGSGSGGSTTTYWTCEATCPNRIVTLSDSECDEVKGGLDITTPLYDMDIDGTKYDGDPIYCLQPGANGPTADGLKYILDTQLDVGRCQDQYVDKNDQNAIQCGLAQILYFAHNHTVNSKGEDVWTRKPEYTDGTITLALRLWMAAYAKTPNGTPTYPSQITDPTYTYTDSEGIENPDDYGTYQAFNASSPLAWVPSEDYYDKTAQKIKNGKKYDTKNSQISETNKDIIFCADTEKSGECVIDKAIKLFHETEKVSKENFLGGTNFNREVPIVQYEVDTGIFEVKFDNRDTISKIKENCEDVNDPECQIEVRLFYGDEDVTDKKIDGENVFKFENISDGIPFCDKNSCVAKIIRTKEFCIGGGYEELKLVIIFKNWTRNYGYVRLYTAAKSDPEKYQKMVSFGIKQEQCESESSEYRNGRVEKPIKIPCNCTPNSCDDLSATESPSSTTTCLSKKTIKDANMNCIVNSCPLDINNEFVVTSKYGLNPLVCTVYERDENELYLPGKTTVYSGMQFSYDLANELKSSLKLDTTHKITAVAMQKKQITSKINYEYWEREYIRKQNLLYYSYLMGYSNEYKNALITEINDWINDLNNCNFVSSGKQSDAIHKINVEISNKGDCKNDSCSKVSVRYDDSNYGIDNQLAVSTAFNNAEIKDRDGRSYRKYYNITNKGFETSRSDDSSIPLNMYYCTNSSRINCYEYENKNTAVEIVMASTSSGKIKSTAKFKRYTSLSDSEAQAGFTYISDDTLRKYNCSGSNCSYSALDIPQNDYVTIIYNVEHDYYNDKNYKAEAYTGVAVEEALTSEEQKAIADGSAKYVPLDKYVYPISVNSKTGEYPVYFTFSNIKNRYRKSSNGTTIIDGDKYSNSCFYKVYNITTSYDCDVMDENGKMDLSKCQDTKYKVVKGVPEIDESKVLWETTDDGTQYGFIFRTVALDDLFPNSKVTQNGISSRASSINWSDKKNVIEEIENGADTIFSDSEKLEYSYTLTPQGIKEIKEYNDNSLDSGGYLNSTLINCKIDNDETGLKKFKNCKSTFLEDIRNKKFPGVETNKDDVLQ